MTDDERKEAERLIRDRLSRCLDAGSGFTFEEEALIELYYCEGYGAGRAARQAEIDALADEYVVSDRIANDKLDAERARAAKLVEAATRALRFGFVVTEKNGELVNVPGELRKALAEYEASK